MSMDKSIPQVHVAVLAFPFGSHARPLMNLVLKLAKSAPNILFSFFNTQKSNDSLVSSSDLEVPINFKFYNVEDGVPPGHRLTGNPLEPLELFLKVADENLRRKIEMVVAETGINITCLITDAFFSFADEIAEKFHASWIPVWISMPCCLSAHVYTRIIRTRFNNGEIGKDQSLDFIPGLSMMRLKDLPPEVFSQDLADSVFSKTLAQIGESFSKATAVGVSSFQEVNPEALNNDLKSKFKNYLNLGFLAVPLPPPPPPSSDSDLTGCLSWLDRQPPKSVAYISFGTVAALPENELKALAEALELSKNPFLWSLKDSFKQNLPTGFVERTSKQGKIVAWAPQAPVLGHNAIAVFLTHAGSISVWESVVCGVPMICRPFFGDHMMVGRMVEEAWGVGLTVEDGVFTTNGLLKNLEIFLRADDEIGKKMRENVQELRKVVLMAAQPSGSAATDFNKLMEIISVA